MSRMDKKIWVTVMRTNPETDMKLAKVTYEVPCVLTDYGFIRRRDGFRGRNAAVV